jgi:hypothetical protein
MTLITHGNDTLPAGERGTMPVRLSRHEGESTKMAVAYYTRFGPEIYSGSETPEVVAQKVADGVRAKIGQNPPAGGVYHAEGPTGDGGWWTFNVWASEGDSQTFLGQILRPALEAAGVGRPAEVQKLEVWWDSSQMGAAS